MSTSVAKSTDGLVEASSRSRNPRGASAAQLRLWDRWVSDSLWTSLRYFNVYRLIVAAFFGIVGLANPIGFGLGDVAPASFVAASFAYVVLTGLFHAVLLRVRRWFDVQLALHVVADIVVITVLMHASGGFRSGLGVMLLISLAGAAVVAERWLTLTFATFATLAVLGEQLAWIGRHGANPSALVHPTILGIGYYVSALITNWLAHRVISNEEIARQRGIELANQVGINAVVIQDVQDGVIVMDDAGIVRQYNRQAELLLGRAFRPDCHIREYSRALSQQLGAWAAGSEAEGEPFVLNESSRRVRARFQAAGVQGQRFVLVFLEDLSRLEAEAQKVKLVALGRLTANIAHEIRNPLSAITHATDLMLEENRAQGRERLCRIIRDNAYRLDRMVKDVLELNRRDRIVPERIELAGFLASFIEDVAHNESLPDGALRLEVVENAVVDIDRVHLHQILWNLVRNAWRHGRQAPGSVRIRLECTQSRVQLHVMDDGPGVPEALRSQLFEPFFTTDSKGTGLGLYISRELAAANGARLDYVPLAAGADFRLQWQGIR
jgi:two-component system sensor histidine kinase PilS (NtrC family)